MDAIFYERPKTWKYAVPWILVALLIPVTGKMVASPNPEIRFWAMAPFGLMIVLFLVGCVKLWEKISSHSAELYTQHQEALAMTPLVLLSQNMKQMHPEAVRVLNRFGVRTNWEVRVNANLGERDWVLMGTNVHFGFIEFVMSRSGKALYPKNRFPQGSKKWDPDGLIEDRVQHEEFELWMFSRLMITRSHGDYKPAEFIPPWNPDLILETLGLTGEQDLYRPDEGSMKDLNKEPVINGNGKTAAKPLDNEPTYHPIPIAPGLDAILEDEIEPIYEQLKGDSQ